MKMLLRVRPGAHAPWIYHECGTWDEVSQLVVNAQVSGSEYEHFVSGHCTGALIRIAKSSRKEPEFHPGAEVGAV